MENLYQYVIDNFYDTHQIKAASFKKWLKEQSFFTEEHIKNAGRNIYEEAYLKFTNTKPKKCLFCDKKLSFYSFKDGYKNNYCSPTCSSKHKRKNPIKIDKCISDNTYNIIDLQDSKKLYNFICSHWHDFINNRKIPTKIEKISSWLKKYQLDKNILEKYNTLEELYNILIHTPDSEKLCIICGGPTRFDFLKGYYSKTCCRKCGFVNMGNNRCGNNNPALRMSDETRKNSAHKQSLTMKKKILTGEFTPCITNSWSHSLISINIIRNDNQMEIKLRSSWEAYFQIFNPKFIYEKIRIPYIFEGIQHNYIVDFLDEENDILYEIKPECNIDTSGVVAKRVAAIDWCDKNGYRYEIITNEWFQNNYKEELLSGQPEEIKLRKRLKQFLKKVKNEN